MTFKAEIKKDTTDNTYYLSTTSNGYQWTSIPIENAEQMILIGKLLINKAKEMQENSD